MKFSPDKEIHISLYLSAFRYEYKGSHFKNYVKQHCACITVRVYSFDSDYGIILGRVVGTSNSTVILTVEVASELPHSSSN